MDQLRLQMHRSLGSRTQVPNDTHDDHRLVHVLQISSDMHQSDNLQKARRATTPGVSWSVALLHILQVVQVRTDLQ